jgi:hypothetical protein
VKSVRRYRGGRDAKRFQTHRPTDGATVVCCGSQYCGFTGADSLRNFACEIGDFSSFMTAGLMNPQVSPRKFDREIGDFSGFLT